MRAYLPATASTLVAAAYVVWRLAGLGWQPIELFELGTRFSQGIEDGSPGYDGQFSYYIASSLDPINVEPKLDVPAYRYQRILYPLSARVVSIGVEAWLPWSFVIVGLLAHWGGTWAVARFLLDQALNPWYALSYGLWVGLVAPIGLGLGEPLAYGLAAGGWLLRARGRVVWSALLFGLALFAKETTIIFLAAAILAELTGQRRGRALVAYLASLAVFIGWQAWLWSTFGSPGLGSGGDMATPFEWIPFMGLFRIGSVDMLVLGLFLLMFLPTIVLPAIWAVIASIRSILKGIPSAEAWSLLGNGIALMVLPFSTFREPLGLVRFASGLVLAVILFSASRQLMRPLRYSLFWTALLAILLAQ
ncbi:MAG: hypothetical protein ACC647_10240 [Anaerolineales bacterium]